MGHAVVQLTEVLRYKSGGRGFDSQWGIFCPAWRSAARTHVQRLQVLQSKCLRLAPGAPWYVRNRQIYEDLGVPLFVDHIRALTASFDSKLADVGDPLVRQIGRYLR